jgi:Siphovirus Gp157
MNITLFDAAQSVREQVSKFDPDTGELSEEYASSMDLFEKKGGACVAFALEELSQIEAAKKMLEAMNKQLAAREARLDRFKSYMAECMKAAGVTQVAADGLARATLYPGRTQAVEIDEGASFPPELCNEPKPPSPSKTKIKAAILAGQPVSGARIVRKDMLTIK